MTPDATAVSSAATEAPALSAVEQAVMDGNDDAFFEARRAERQGTPLDPTKAASSPAEPAEQAASTDANQSSASEPDKAKDTKDGKGAAARSAQLKAEVQELEGLLRRRKELRQELASLDKGGKPADTPAADPAGPPAEDDLEAFASLPGAPKEADYADYTRYVLALARFAARHEGQQLVSQALQQYDAQTRSRSVLDASVERGRKDFADFDDVVAQAAALVQADPTLALPAHVQQAVASMADGHRLGYALAQKVVAGDSAFLARLSNPVAAGMALAELLSSTDTPSKASPPPVVSNAPAPPVTLGRKPTVAPDAIDAAVAADDEEAFFRARAAQRAAAMR